jgi:hypothetical protein
MSETIPETTPAPSPEAATAPEQPTISEWRQNGRLLGFTVPAGASGSVHTVDLSTVVPADHLVMAAPYGWAAADLGVYVDQFEAGTLTVNVLHAPEQPTFILVSVLW